MTPDLDIPESIPQPTINDPELARWFGSSVVRDEQGLPLLVHRGEHGQGPALETRLGTLSFGTKKAASTYAREPNNRKDTPANPRLIEAYLRIERPFLNDPDDPFVDLGLIASKLGAKEARRIALKFDEQIQHTNNWEENFGERYTDVASLLKAEPKKIPALYFDAYHLLDDPLEVNRIAAAGYDGAIHGGSGVTALEPEYKVFSPSQVRIVNLHALDARTTSMPQGVPNS